jgi:hypothetical protein
LSIIIYLFFLIFLKKKEFDNNFCGVEVGIGRVGRLYKERGERSKEMTESPTTPSTGGRSSNAKPSLMESLLGLLRIRVKRGVNLAVRDVRSSDPYVVVKMGKQVWFLHQFLSFLPLLDGFLLDWAVVSI